MADSILAQSLLKYTASPSDPVDNVYHQPFTATVDGQIWAVATTGHTFMAVKGKASYPVFDGNRQVAELINLPADAWEDVVVRDLRNWCGTSEELDEAVVDGYVFNRARIAKLLIACPFPKIRMGTTRYGKTPALIMESLGKWRAVLGALDCDPEDDMPVWGKVVTAEARLFDLAMELD
jgi:hypothetical protein